MTPGANQLWLLPTSSMEPLQHIHTRANTYVMHSLARLCTPLTHIHTHKHTPHTHTHKLPGNAVGMISQGLSPPCRAGSRNPARFWGAVEVFRSRRGVHFRDTTAVYSCSPPHSTPTVIWLHESRVIPATASGLNSFVMF